ncbi:MAG: hypothetical protein ACON5J_10700, partial [Rubripirellula sp.]
MKCPSCNTTLNIPSHLIGKTVKCRCGNTLKAGAAGTKKTQSLKIQCPQCSRTLGVQASSVGKPVKCPCGHRFNVPKPPQKAVTPATFPVADDLDFSSINTAALQSGKVKKGPSYLDAKGSGEPANRKDSKNKKTSKNYASGMLSEVSSEFADSAAMHKSDAKRRKFLATMSILFACILIPPILFVVYRSINAASEGYANWGDRVQETVVSMKLQTADPEDRASDLSEISGKRGVGLPKQPTPGRALEFAKDDQFSTDADVRIMLEQYYPGWVCDKVQLDVSGKIFRATMKYAPPPIDLPPRGDYKIGDKSAALAAVEKENLQATPEDASRVFLQSGFFSGELECTEVNRLPGEITLNCSIKSVRDIVPARDYPGMKATIDQLQNTTFKVVLNVDDSMTAKERKSTDTPEEEGVDYG